MTITIDRKTAKKIIAQKQYHNFWEHQKLEILEVHYDLINGVEAFLERYKKGEIPTLNDEAIQLIETNQHLNIPFSEHFEPLLIQVLINKLHGATNDYLNLHLSDYRVSGEVEKRGLCACCGYYSLRPKGNAYEETCPVCHWQNKTYYYGISLETAKANFKKFGAMSKGSLKRVEKDGRIKYSQER